jgi:cell division septation protein DedD
MKNNWTIPLIAVVAIVSVLIYFNYQRSQEAVPLSDLFKDESQNAQKVEYEFVSNTEQPVVTVPQVVSPVATTSNKAAAPVVGKTAKVFSIQVASYKEKDKADKSLEKIKVKYPQAYVGTRDLGDKGIWYRIYVGEFQKKEEADQMLTSVKTDYPQSFIITK